MKIENMNGADIEVTYTNSDGFAKSEWVDVYLSPTGPGSFLQRLTTKKELIFRYDPAGSGDPILPHFRESGPKTIQIDVPHVSSVLEQHRRWKDLSLEYHIEHVDFH